MKFKFARIIFCFFLFPFISYGQKNLSKEDLAFWKDKAKPLLQENCWKCHGAEKKIRGDLVLTTRQGILDGGEIGPAVDLDKPEASLLLQMVSYEDEDHQMPPKGKLSDEQIAILGSWVKRGLPFHPEDEIQFHHEKEENWSNTVVNERTKAHWAYVKPIDHSPPSGTGAKHPIDAFILDKLNKSGLPANQPAKPSALLRRAHFDLIGLPPELDQVDAFVEDHSEKAFEETIDRLLASPHYGEKWGRHWLDLVRYAETNGYERDGDKPSLEMPRLRYTGISMRTNPTTASCKNSWQGTNYPKRMRMRSPQPGFTVWVSGTTNRLTVNLPAMITWTTFSEPRETYFWPCPLAAHAAMITKSIRYPRRITIPSFLSSPTCLLMEKEIPIWLR